MPTSFFLFFLVLSFSLCIKAYLLSSYYPPLKVQGQKKHPHSLQSMASSSWVRSITTPFRKARTFFNPQKGNRSQQQQQQQQEDDDHSGSIDLQGEVMACAYEDVQVMWSILDNSKQKLCKIPS